MRTKPTSFSDNWGRLPVLACPSDLGWEIWEAIKERIFYTFGSSWHQAGKPVAPDYMQAFYGNFPLLGGCKETELIMFNSITDLVPYYRYISNGQYVQMTMQHVLSSIGDASRAEPSPYYLSAEWLWQSYKIINHLRKHVNIVFMALDELKNDYYIDENTGNAKQAWYDDKTLLMQAMAIFPPFDLAVVSILDGTSMDAAVPKNDSLPAQIKGYAFNWDTARNHPEDFVSFLQPKIQQLISQYDSSYDDSLVCLNTSTVAPWYYQFLEWLEDTCKLTVVDRGFFSLKYMGECVSAMNGNYLPEFQSFAFQAGDDPNED